MQYSHPLIVSFGEDLTNQRDFKVIIERDNIIQVKSMLSAIEFCLSSYYTFNIKFDANSKAMCHFMEFLYGIDVSCRKLPLCVQSLIDGVLRQN